MFVKLMRGADGEHDLFQCNHVGIKRRLEKYERPGGSSRCIGFSVELSPGPTIRLPEDGHTVYLENDLGNTINVLRWPEPARSEVA